MNHVYAFPDAPLVEGAGCAEGVRRSGERIGLPRPADVPDEVWSAVLSVMAMQRLGGIEYREIEVPCALADFGIGVSLRCAENRSEGLLGASGWIMALYTRNLGTAWGTHWRCTAYARVPYDDCANDDLAAQMVWDEMRMAMEPLSEVIPSGTVSVTRDRSFGLNGPDTADGPDGAGESGRGSKRAAAGCELRVSWTPAGVPGVEIADEIGTHIEAWTGFLRSMSMAVTGNAGNEEEIALG